MAKNPFRFRSRARVLSIFDRLVAATTSLGSIELYALLIVVIGVFYDNKYNSNSHINQIIALLAKVPFLSEHTHHITTHLDRIIGAVIFSPVLVTTRSNGLLVYCVLLYYIGLCHAVSSTTYLFQMVCVLYAVRTSGGLRFTFAALAVFAYFYHIEGFFSNILPSGRVKPYPGTAGHGHTPEQTPSAQPPAHHTPPAHTQPPAHQHTPPAPPAHTPTPPPRPPTPSTVPAGKKP
jgi:hypothetical protein